MIPYSIVMRPNPMNENDPKKAYATAQQTDVMTLEQFAEHISSHGSKYGEEDITAVAILITNCLVEQLLEGKKVQMGKLGEFSLSLSSKGAKSAEEFTAENIEGVNLIYTPGRAFATLRKRAKVQPVATRRAQAATLAAEKKGETTVDISKKENGAGGTGSGTGNTGGSGSAGQGTDQP